SHRSADRNAKTILVSSRKRGRAAIGLEHMVVAPQVRRADVAAEVELVQSAVEVVGSALGHHLNLAARSAVEVRRLACGAVLEFFDALDRCRDHARRGSAGGTAAAITVTRGIRRVGPGHVVAIIPTIEREMVLIPLSSGHVPVKSYADLKDG